MDSASIPVMRSPNDLMINGPNSDNLAAAAIQSHPVDRMQRATKSTTSLDVDSIRRLYGSALAMRLTTERIHASNVGGRLPGLDAHPNSNTMLETLTGDDITIDFGDYLNTKMERAQGGLGGQNMGVHDAMEVKLGL
mmetsp:Transcript_27695/g.41022  ORF Transcript_27695/g.41022 Transcript_27695/m.41022 type:complete len:137 (+) Transcript_27695:98-508(+)